MRHGSRFDSGQVAKQQRRLKIPYDCGAKEQRESKSVTFFEAISQLSREVFQLEELASRVVGRVTGATQGGNQVAPPEPSPCPALVLNMYPDKLRELRERIQKAKDEIVEALF